MSDEDKDIIKMTGNPTNDKLLVPILSVSYTHLDVYKRQPLIPENAVP